VLGIFKLDAMRDVDGLSPKDVVPLLLRLLGLSHTSSASPSPTSTNALRASVSLGFTRGNRPATQYIEFFPGTRHTDTTGDRGISKFKNVGGMYPMRRLKIHV
jgi:hypothetical protein